VTNYYELLEIAASATGDEVKRAFRTQIALYHPDKVQHLGREFQSMAADRAALLTEAYRILSDAGRRADYDRARLDAGPAAADAPAPNAPPVAPDPQHPADPPPSEASPVSEDRPIGAQFRQVRASRDEYVRKATVSRFSQALEAVGGEYSPSEAPGFDLALAPRSKLFARGKGPKLLGRFVSLVDRQAVADAWTQAGKWSAADDVCVFLMGSALAPAGELAAEIASQRRRQPEGRLTLIPVDARNWDAHIPTNAPAIAKTLLARLKTGR
jgi:curved DNA-binding protein CbpA